MGAPAIAATTAFTAFTQYRNGQAQQKASKAQAETSRKLGNYNALAVENAANYNAGVMRSNADALDAAAEDAIIRGADASGDEITAGVKANATGRANQAASGTIVGTGTNAKLLEDNAAFAAQNALIVQNNAEREAYGYKTQASSTRAEATGTLYTASLQAENLRIEGEIGALNSIYEGKQQAFAGKVDAVGSIVSGGSKVADKYPEMFKFRTQSSAVRK